MKPANKPLYLLTYKKLVTGAPSPTPGPCFREQEGEEEEEEEEEVEEEDTVTLLLFNAANGLRRDFAPFRAIGRLEEQEVDDEAVPNNVVAV